MSLLLMAMAMLLQPDAASDAGEDRAARYFIPHPATQSSVYWRAVSPADRARAQTDILAVCMTTQDRSRVNEVLELGNTLDGRKAQAEMNSKSCLKRIGSNLSVNSYYASLLRASIIADYAGNSFFLGELEPLDPEGETLVVRTKGSGGTASVERKPSTALSPQGFSRCVFGSDFANATRFVIESAGSSEEDEALSNLTPALEACASYLGGLSLTKQFLSQILTETLFEMLGAAREVDADA